MKYPRDSLCSSPSFIAVSQNTYQVACTLVQELAESKGDLGCLLDAGINPFFIIYACADCDVPLPRGFNLELFWRHLDATLQAQCWRGLGANRTLIVEESSEESTDGGEPEEPPEFAQMDDDPEGILESLMTITIESEGTSDSNPVHKLSIAVREGQWIAQSELGRMWYDASDLADKDVAPFAMLDSLTRGLPQWSGGILKITTQDVRLLWGVCGRPHSGAWTIVRALCRGHDVELRGQWAGLHFRDMALPADPRKRAALVPRRSAEVVGAVVEELGMNGGNGAYRRMICHLTAGL
ncbi:hypothetical protein BC826DRAFT_553533 [Russula brevipes]|nr:hypothetical protein BC826DRAFT_553533 [Russula brevipes]